MNKVKRGKQYEHGYWKELRWTWICVECGREWVYRNYAQRCEHTNQLMFYSHDDIAEPLNLEEFL